MALGAFYVIRRPRAPIASPGLPSSATVAPNDLPSVSKPLAPAVVDPAPKLVNASSSKLLEALKEELFELEVERKQGRLSQEEYDKARSALDHTLERALKRQS
jgi:hypothetical protein